MLTITSGEFQKEFGRYRTEAHKSAVIITNHGREDLALISVEEYKRLCQLDQQTMYAWELSDGVLDEMDHNTIPERAKQFDHEYKS